MTEQTKPVPVVRASRRFAVYDERELISIVTAVSFFLPAGVPGSTGNLVFHDSEGVPTAVFAAGSWTQAETTNIPDAPPVNMAAGPDGAIDGVAS